MALELVVFPQEPSNELNNIAVGGLWDMEGGDGSCDPSCSSMLQNIRERDVDLQPANLEAMAADSAASTRRRLWRQRSMVRCEGREEVESQRMNHIAVERNRRKQMNQYLAMLQNLIPPFYSQRSDQASVVGNAINYVKELEQVLQSLIAKNGIKKHLETAWSPSLLSDGFFPCSSFGKSGAMAFVMVTTAESHANLRILVKRRPRLLTLLVEGLQDLRLTILHLNVTAADPMILCSFSLKVEEDCGCSSADEIKIEVSQMLERMQMDRNAF